MTGIKLSHSYSTFCMRNEASFRHLGSPFFQRNLDNMQTAAEREVQAITKDRNISDGNKFKTNCMCIKGILKNSLVSEQSNGQREGKVIPSFI